MRFFIAVFIFTHELPHLMLTKRIDRCIGNLQPLQGNHERDALEEMRAAEAAGTFVYQPPEGEDQEFVDAPQQPETQGDELSLLYE